MSSLVEIDVNVASGTVLSNSGINKETTLTNSQISDKFELYYSCSVLGDNNNNDGNKIEIVFYDEDLHMADASNLFVPVLEEGLKNYQVDIPFDVHKVTLSFWGDYTIDYFQLYSVFDKVEVEIATETEKGIANFPDANFVVADGAISLNQTLRFGEPVAGTEKRGTCEMGLISGGIGMLSYNTNNNSFEGIGVVNGVPSTYNPITDSWDALGGSAILGTGNVVFHTEDAWSDTMATGTNALHIGIASAGTSTGKGTEIRTLLGWQMAEIVTEELPDTPAPPIGGRPLFVDGDECNSTTGGWSYGYHGSGPLGECKNTGQYMYFYQKYSNSSYACNSSAYTQNKIDFTNANKIIVNFAYETYGRGHVLCVALREAKENVYPQNKCIYTTEATLGYDYSKVTTGELTIEIDTQSITGLKYMQVGSFCSPYKDRWTKTYVQSIYIV